MVLRRAGAKGTQDGALYAFGLHFNPEMPRREAETSSSFLKTFALLNAWLRREVAPDATRALLGFADPFPRDYVRKIADPDYRPDLGAFIDDYLAANPTRNRDLDLLPLLPSLDEERVRRVLPNEKINARPTFHYRLPDARVSDPGWSIAPDWNRWVAVERLAADRDRLDAVGAAYLAPSRARTRAGPTWRRGRLPHEPAADRRHHLPPRRLAQLSDASSGARAAPARVRCGSSPGDALPTESSTGS